MAHNTSRLTLFSILSAIEIDLREEITNHLIPQLDLSQLLYSSLLDRAKDRLRRDRISIEGEDSIEKLIDYIDFGDAFFIINMHRNLLPQDVSAYFKSITSTLEKLVPIRNRVMHSRPLNYNDFPYVIDAAEEFIKSNSISWRSLNTALIKLKKEPGFVLGLRMPNHIDETNHKHNLPIPDFDETGFLGREQQKSELIKKCLGPYPVITIVGEGGLGKTALALRVAYDILDMEDQIFDAIVWTSSKTTQVTPQEIKGIEGAIQDSLGMFQSISDHLTGVKTHNPFEEVLSYLKEFKILLILDNLETVLDERIKKFLEQLPSGSKILITSRIGLGDMEMKVKLDSMDKDDSIALLRTLAKTRGLQNLFKMNNKKLGKYCEKMKNNPGFLKWFISAVQVGKRPEEILEHPDIFLEFCMSNVYEYLDEDSRKILKCLLCIPGKYSQAELAFLNNDMDEITLQSALLNLLRTNMINIISIPIGITYDSKYELSELARKYLINFHPPDSKENTEFLKRNRKLIAINEETKGNQNNNPYSNYTIHTRSKSDYITAKHLSDVLSLARNKKFDDAEILISKARKLSPQYFEVYRVDAFIKTDQNLISAANNLYEMAIDLEPEHAPLRLFYGSFLMKHMSDTEAALVQFTTAESLDKYSIEIKTEISRAYLYLMRFDDALNVITSLRERSDLSDQDKRIFYDMYIQVFYRKSDYLLSQRSFIGALNELEYMKEAYEEVPRNLVDNRMVDRLRKSLFIIKNCLNNIPNPLDAKRARKLEDWLNNDVLLQSFRIGNIMKGDIIQLWSDQGLIQTTDGHKIKFHKDDFIDPSKFHILHLRDKVVFLLSKKEDHFIAKDIRFQG